MVSPGITLHPISADFNWKQCSFYYFGPQLASKNSPFFFGFPNIKYKSPEDRFYKLSTWAMDIIPPDSTVFMEGYAYNARGKTFEIGENTGLLKHMLWKNDIRFSIISPTELKRFATGKGNAKKEDMLAAFINDTHFDIHDHVTPKKKRGTSPVSDIIDSYFLCKMALTQRSKTL